MTKQILTAFCMLFIAAALGCGSQESDDAGPALPEGREVKKAIAWVNALGDNEFQGSAIFIKDGDQIELQVSVDPQAMAARGISSAAPPAVGSCADHRPLVDGDRGGKRHLEQGGNRPRGRG